MPNQENQYDKLQVLTSPEMSIENMLFDLRYYSYEFQIMVTPELRIFRFNFEKTGAEKINSAVLSKLTGGFSIELKVGTSGKTELSEVEMIQFTLFSHSNTADAATGVSLGLGKFEKKNGKLVIRIRLDATAQSITINWADSDHPLLPKNVSSEGCSKFHFSAQGTYPPDAITILKVNDYANGIIKTNETEKNTRLDLSNAGLEFIPVKIFEFDWLEEVIIGASSYFDYAEQRYLNTPNTGIENSFTSIPAGFSRLRNLKSLVIVIGKTKLTAAVPLADISLLGKLTFLSIINAGMSDISPIAAMVQLEKLYIYDNQISDLNPLSFLKNLRILRIRGNRVNDIRPLTTLTRLRVLRIGKNKVTDLSPISHLSELVDISMYSNSVTDLSPLQGLTKLKKLVVRDNKVTSIQALEALANLELLDARSNQIVDITALEKLINLKKLLLRKNKITNIAALAGLINLEELSLSENKIVNIYALAKTTSLLSLECYDNLIDNIEALGFLSKLKKLNVSKNPFSNIDAVATMHALIEIDFSQTTVTDITPLTVPGKLEELYFDQCQVTNLRPIAQLSLLEKFSCIRNPIKDCPADVYESGDPMQVRSFFEASSNAGLETVNGPQDPTNKPIGKTSLKRDVKLIILGNSNTGKTNFVNYLEKNQFNGNRKTSHGLEVHRWEPDRLVSLA